MPPRLDLHHLKRAVSIQQVLMHRGWLGRLRRRAGQLVGPCPVHGGDNHHAFVVDPDRNLWHCFTGCRGGGDVVELVRRLDGCGYRRVAEYLHALEDAPLSAPSQPPAPPTRSKTFRPFTRRLPLEHEVSFLTSKGIRPETARRFEVGFFAGRGMLEQCIAVRLHTPGGQALGYAGRRLCPELVRRRGKWSFPPGLPKSTLLYGYHQAVQLSTDVMIVVECPWGVLRLLQLGLPAVALLGCSLSPTQRALLDRFRRLLLLMDGDSAGQRAAGEIQASLRQSQRIALADGVDPDELSDDELGRLRGPLLCP